MNVSDALCKRIVHPARGFSVSPLPQEFTPAAS